MKRIHACQHCEYEAEDKIILIEHIKTNHQQLSMLNSLFSQQNLFCESFHVFKQDIGELLNTLIQGQSIMKSELLLLKEKSGSNEDTVAKAPELNTKPSTDESAPGETYAKKAAKKDNRKTGCPPTKARTAYQSKKKVLYVSDSVGRTVVFPIVEMEMDCTIKTANAYSSIEDKNAFWPKRNFTDVVKAKLAKVPTDCLVMSAPTVDISNIDTSGLKQSDSTDKYQKMVNESCRNMFNTAHDAIENHPNIEKVVIMEHAPRHDENDVDPLKLKPTLARYANNIFSQL